MINRFSLFLKVAFALGIAASFLLSGRTAGYARPMHQTIRWSKEEIIAQFDKGSKQSYFPVIAADPYGTVHIFWTQGEAIYYRYKETIDWSSPIDVVWSDTKSITFPSVAIDQQGFLHLAWFVYGDIRYKSVPAWEARNLHRWGPEKTIVSAGGFGTPLRLVVDPQDNLHIVFVDQFGKPGVTEAGNVYHIFSVDHGATWSQPYKVSQISQNRLATDPRIAIDLSGNAHIVWGLMDLDQDALQLGVYYARLDPDGKLQSNPVEIMHRLPDDKWLMGINIAIRNEDEIHLTWVCGEQAKRCQTWSKDGGHTWAPNQRLFKDLLGLSGWDALVVDSAKNLFWLTVLRYPQGMYNSIWEETNWIDPPLIASTDDYMKLGENVMASVGQGNQIHLVIQLGYTISYMTGFTPATREDPKPVPVISPLGTPSLSPEALKTDTLSFQETKSPLPAEILNLNQPKIVVTQGRILTISSLSVILIILMVALIRALKGS